MHHHAANTAAQPYLSLSIFSAPTASPEDRSGDSEKPSYCGAFTSSLWLRLGRASAAELDECDSVQWESSASFPVLYSGSRFGAYPAPCGTASFCFGCAALSGSRFLPEQVCKRAAKSAAQTSSGPRQESTPWHLGAGPTTLAARK
jgi:hypothetical protein